MFRFTIRDVLWLMVVVGLAVGWWTDSRRQAKVIKTAQDRAENSDLNTLTLYDACKKEGWTVEFHHGEIVIVQPPGKPPPSSGPLPLPTSNR
jgi:hypothetical protein